MGDSSNTTRRERWLITSGCLVLLLIAVGVTIAFFQAVATRAEDALEAELAALREAGHPVYPEDILVEASEHDPTTAVWLRGFQSIPRRGSSNSEESFDPDWADCVRRQDGALALLHDVGFDRFLDETDVPNEATPCERVALKLAYGETEERYERALEVVEHGPFDVLELLREKGASPRNPLPQLSTELRVSEYLDATRILSNSAILSAIGGEAERAARELTLSLRIARLMQDQHCLLGEQLASTGLGNVLRALEVVLHYAEPEADLTEIESFLTDWDPRRDLRKALMDERALANGMFRMQRQGDFPLLSGEAWSFGDKTGIAVDFRMDTAQLLYLETLSRVLDACAPPQFDWEETCDRELEEMRDSWWVHPSHQGLELSASDLHELALTHVVRRDLALAALRIHRGGLEATEAALDGRVDPFGGQPYRRRVDGDRLLMWSLGRSGTDAASKVNSSRSPLAGLAWRCWKSAGDPSEAPVSLSAVENVPSSALLTALEFDFAREVGIAVGGSGEQDPAEILRTTTGGETWQRVEAGIDQRLYDIAFRNEREMFAVGLGGQILHSTDSGATWGSVRRGDEWLAGVAFSTQQYGWIVGSRGEEAVLLRSNDGGSTWRDGPDLPEGVRESSLRAIEFRDARFGCVVGTGGALLLTRDGGEVWTSYPAGSAYLRGIEFASDGTIWIVGGPGVVLRSVDGGETFENRPFPVQSKLNSIAFATPMRGWATTMEGELFETLDGGDTWNSILRNESLHLTGIRAPRVGKPGFVVGDRGTILRLELGR